MKNWNFKVEMEVKIDEEAIGNIICTALEGGINYWAYLDNTGERWHRHGDEDKPWSEIATEILLEGGSITLVDEEDDNKRHNLNLDMLLRGIKEYVNDYYNPKEYIDDGEFFADNIDAGDADNIIQLAVFGEFVYG